LRPAVTILVQDGVTYLLNSYATDTAVRVTTYWVKEKGVWVKYDKAKEFPVNTKVQYYPNDEEFGQKSLPSNIKYFVTSYDGILYATNYEVIPVTATTIRISNYYQRDDATERWYFFSSTLDLDKASSKIEQMRP
jgi:hypothetical protein